MTAQTALAFEARTVPDWMAHPPNERAERFVEFHRDNPHVYDELESRVLRLYRAGAQRIGVRMVWESLRYDFTIDAIERGDDEYRLNDWYPPFYARLLIHDHPRLDRCIETRGW